MKNDIIHTLEKGDVRVEDIEMDDSLKGLLITFGAYFNVDEKFSLETKDNPEEWVNLYGLYSPVDEKITLNYTVSKPQKDEYLSYYPTAEESQALIETIKEYCQKHNNMNCYNFYLHTYCEYHARSFDLVCEKADNGYQVRNMADNFILFKSEDDNMERFVGHNIDLVSYGNDETYSIESLDSCEVIFSTDTVDCEVQEDDEEMEV